MRFSLAFVSFLVATDVVVVHAFSPPSPSHGRAAAIVVVTDRSQPQVSKPASLPSSSTSPLFRRLIKGKGKGKLQMTEFTNIIVPGFILISSMALSILSAREDRTVAELIRSSSSDIDPLPLDVTVPPPPTTMAIDATAERAVDEKVNVPPPIPETKPVVLKSSGTTKPDKKKKKAATAAAATSKEDGSERRDQMRMEAEARLAREAAATARARAEAKRKALGLSPKSQPPIPLVRFVKWLWRAIQKILAPWRPWKNISA